MTTENIIYHYTSLDALISILNPNENQDICFWVTHAEFMNDPAEYRYALSLLKPSLEKYERANFLESKMSEKVSNIGASLLKFAPGEPFLFSFSELSDDLSMWRSYGADGSGISIGLDKEILETRRYDGNCDFLKCSYSRTENIADLSVFWRDFYEALPNFIENGSIDGDHFFSLFKFLSHSFRLKNKAYSSELEWRFCKYVFTEDINYRIRNGLVIPFAKLFFPKNIIKEIIIGPSAKADLSKKAIEMALKTFNYQVKKDFVKISEVPYRSI